MQRKDHFAAFFVFISIFLLYGVTLVGGMNSSDGTNYALTKALAEEGTPLLTNYRYYTYNTDYAVINGTIVSDREVGISVLALPFYQLGKTLSPYVSPPYAGTNDAITTESTLQMITYLSLIFFVAGGLALSYYCYRALHIATIPVLITLFSVACGSLLWKYSASFSRYPIDGICLFLISLLVLLYEKQSSKKQYLFFAGILFGIALLGDYLIAFPAFFFFLLYFTRKHHRKNTLLFLSGFLPFLFSAGLYNYIVFGSPLSSPHSYEGNFLFMRHFENNFKTPFFWGAWLQLFSNAPIPREAIPWVLQNETVAQQLGARWALHWTYKGIFFQSPILLFCLAGWFYYGKKNPFPVLIIFIMFLSIFLPMSFFTQFWSPNTYDSRHLLGVTLLLFCGLPFIFSRIKKSPLLLVMFLLLLILSVYFGFSSSITNFGPNISGEHRYSIPLLLTDLGKKNFSAALIQVFPNIYNLLFLTCIGGVLYLLGFVLFLFLTKRVNSSRKVVTHTSLEG